MWTTNVRGARSVISARFCLGVAPDEPELLPDVVLSHLL